MDTTLKSAAYGDFLVEYVKGLKSKKRQCDHCKVVIKAIIKIEVVYEIQTKSINSETVVMFIDYLKNLPIRARNITPLSVFIPFGKIR